MMAVGHIKWEQDRAMKYERCSGPESSGPEVKGRPRRLTIWA